MNATKIAGIVLILLGLVGFFTGGFSFTKESTAAKIGPIELTVKEKESVNIPQWLSLGAVALWRWELFCWSLVLRSPEKRWTADRVSLFWPYVADCQQGLREDFNDQQDCADYCRCAG